MAHTGTYGGVSAETRQAERRQRLLDACVTVVGEQGWPSATVRNICSAAQLNPRYFYESFSGLDELLVSVFDQTIADALAVILADLAAAPATSVDQANALFGTFIREMTSDPRRARLAFTEAMGSEALMRRRLAAVQQLADLVAHIAMAHYGTTGLVQAEADINAHILVGGLIESVAATIEGRLDATADQLADGIARAFLATNNASNALNQSR